MQNDLAETKCMVIFSSPSFLNTPTEHLLCTIAFIQNMLRKVLVLFIFKK